MGFLSEFWAFLRVRKKYWLVPLMIATVILGACLLAAQSAVVTPFIYTLF